MFPIVVARLNPFTSEKVGLSRLGVPATGRLATPLVADPRSIGRPRPAGARAKRPYLGGGASPGRARPREAPAGAARPRRAHGTPRLRLPSRPAASAPWPAALPPSAAPVGPALRPRPPPRGSLPGPGARAGRRRAGLPGSSGLAGLGLPGRRPARGRAQVAPGRALFLARAALPVRPTEPVDSAARAGPAPPPELPGKARAALLKTDPLHSCLRFAGKPAASSLNAAPGPRAQGQDRGFANWQGSPARLSYADFTPRKTCPKMCTHSPCFPSGLRSSGPSWQRLESAQSHSRMKKGEHAGSRFSLGIVGWMDRWLGVDVCPSPTLAV